MRPEQTLPAEKQALDNLLRIAQRDTGQSRRVADFLLAWWNAGQCGSYDLTAAWASMTTSWKTCAWCSVSPRGRTATRTRSATARSSRRSCMRGGPNS
jgi:hypothetical protein